MKSKGEIVKIRERKKLTRQKEKKESTQKNLRRKKCKDNSAETDKSSEKR